MLVAIFRFCLNTNHLNFLLKNLEASLLESHLLVGEKLLDNRQVTSLYESHRNLWEAKVDGFEIEMQITPSRVKACSCECPIFLENKMCGHLAAGLLSLRRHLSEKKASKKSPNKVYQKLTVNAILDQVGKDELSAFVRYFARSNRSFSNALKTRFAGLVPMEDNAEKYRQVLDSVMKTARNKNDRISANGARQLLATGRDLVGQAKDALALEHYVDGWSIIQVLIEKVVPVVNRTDFETDNFLEFIEQCFASIQSLVEQPIPPALKNEIWDYIKNVAPRPIYRGYNISVYFFKQLFPLADDKNKRIALLDLVNNELKFSKNFSKKYVRQLITVKLAILEKRGFAKELEIYIEEVLENTEHVLLVVGIGIDNNNIKTAKSLAKKGLTISGHHLYQYRLKVLLLDIAVAEKNKKDIIKWAGDCFVASGQVKYIRLAKQFNGEKWESYIDRLANQIKTSNPIHRNEYLANLYAEEKYFDELSAIIRSNNSLDFLMKHDECFLPENVNTLYTLYVELLDYYFSNHIGKRPTQKMLLIFNHLRQLNAQKLVDKLVAFVRKNHPKRMELAMELLIQ